MEFNAADIFEGVVDRIPDREAVVLGSTRLTYQELDARTNKAANALKKLGIKKGDRVFVNSGKDSGKIGEVMKIQGLKAIVKDVNVSKKNQKGYANPNSSI